MLTPVYTVLVIEDDLPLKMLIAQHLASLNYNVLTARSWKDAQALLELNEPDLIILDIRLPDANGLDLIKGLAGGYAVIVLTAYGSITNAVRAIKEGAFEYLTKPITQEELELNVARAMENLALKRNYVFVRDQQRAARPGVVVGTSEAMNTLMGLVNAVAQSNATVLIHGESGAGKEIIAHEIHERSPRAGRNYVALDCCTLQDNLFESELFGHERGAFTGANALKRGLVEAADGGTLFLDEIGEISPAAQAKLLRVIETKQYRRVGGTKDLAGDVRIVAATNRDLAEMAREGRFRADLYYRLSAFELKVPPLRQRREDIPALAYHFIEKHDFSRRVVKKLSPAAERALIEYDWPGNVRELRNVIERAIILSGSDGTIKLPHVTLSDAAQTRGAVTLSFEREVKLEDVKRVYVEAMHRKYSGHRSRLARALGVSERNLYRLLLKYGLE
jgi:two-component system NtrC family response regulator